MRPHDAAQVREDLVRGQARQGRPWDRVVGNEGAHLSGVTGKGDLFGREYDATQSVEDKVDRGPVRCGADPVEDPLGVLDRDILPRALSQLDPMDERGHPAAAFPLEVAEDGGLPPPERHHVVWSTIRGIGEHAPIRANHLAGRPVRATTIGKPITRPQCLHGRSAWGDSGGRRFTGTVR